MSKLKITGKLNALIAVFIIAILVFHQISTGRIPNVKSTNAVSGSGTGANYEITVKRDLLALMLAYPEQIKGVEKDKDNMIFVIMQSGRKILYDDKKEKSYESKLANADLEDTLEMVYPLSSIDTLMQGNFDPGRIRNYALLKEVYGGTQKQTSANLTTVTLGSKNCQFNKKNNAATSLKATFSEISGLVKSNSNIYGFVYPVNGTYNYRVIAGTNQLSPHAFGITIDLKSNQFDYWKWATKEQGQSRLNTYPKDLVKAFENNGFIWGGKWAHFDILHFEYRPELIIKSKYYLGTSEKMTPWFSGFPDTDVIKDDISIIDQALA